MSALANTASKAVVNLLYGSDACGEVDVSAASAAQAIHTSQRLVRWARVTFWVGCRWTPGGSRAGSDVEAPAAPPRPSHRVAASG